jgi:hypothetical protein
MRLSLGRFGLSFFFDELRFNNAFKALSGRSLRPVEREEGKAPMPEIGRT